MMQTLLAIVFIKHSESRLTSDMKKRVITVVRMMNLMIIYR